MAPPLDIGPTLGELAAHLRRWRAVWEPRPFVEGPPPWVGEEPALARWLRARSAEEVEVFEEDPAAHPEAPALLRMWTAQAAAFEARLGPPPAVSASPQTAPPGRHVPAAKARQIAALLPLLPRSRRPVDWCAGKGHLARALALRDGEPVQAVERDERLCAAGEELARREGAAITFRAADVLGEDLGGWLGGEATLHALHACGDLGLRALRHARAGEAEQVCLAPCCYHRIEGDWRPLCPEAGELRLRAVTLRLATSEEVRAAPRLRRARRRAMRLRLAVDLLLRERRGEDRFHVLPSWPDAWAAEGLAGLIRRLNEARGLELPEDAVRLARVEAEAAVRLHEARALGMARAPFRRPLELWLVLDRARWLERAGMRVEVRLFCARAVSPRNVLVRAGWSGVEGACRSGIACLRSPLATEPRRYPK